LNRRSSESHPSSLGDGRVASEEGEAKGRSSESHPSSLGDGRVASEEGEAKVKSEKYVATTPKNVSAKQVCEPLQHFFIVMIVISANFATEFSRTSTIITNN
jgi:hypothetical protein